MSAFPFQRYDAALITAACRMVLRLFPKTIPIKYGRSRMFYRLDNYAPKSVSAYAMETAWAKYPATVAIVCSSWTRKSHESVIIISRQAMRRGGRDVSSGL